MTNVNAGIMKELTARGTTKRERTKKTNIRISKNNRKSMKYGSGI